MLREQVEVRMVDMSSLLHVPQQWRSSLLHKQTRPRKGCGNSMFSSRTPGVPSSSPWLPPPPWLSPNSPHCPPLISRLDSCVWSWLLQKKEEERDSCIPAVSVSFRSGVKFVKPFRVASPSRCCAELTLRRGRARANAAQCTHADARLGQWIDSFERFV